MKVLLALLVVLPLMYCASIEERFILDTFGLDIGTLTNMVVAALGSDATEAQCEHYCGTVPFAASLCPTVCRTFQSAVSG